MRGSWTRHARKTAVGMAVIAAVTGGAAAGGDDNGSGLFGRLFRSGNNNPPPSTPAPRSASTQPSPLPYGSMYGNTLGSGSPARAGMTPSTMAPVESAAPAPSAFGGLPETPPVGDGGDGQRLTPRSRVSSAVTNADPVLTRFALGRSNDGSAFGMFLQVFADGTVVDSEGVHHVRPGDIKPIMDAVQSGELYRMRGHCGAPSTDFVEYVHLVVYERRFGRLQAHSFSYSGNPQGCDHIVRHLHTAVETLQAKISRSPQPGAGTSSPAGTAMVPPATPGAAGGFPIAGGGSSPYRFNSAPVMPAGAGHQPTLSAAAPAAAGPVISLTPADPNH